MSNGTIIFDFDSTLIQVESLEEILKEKLHNHPEKQNAFEELTNKGMNGEISFYESLSERLAIAKPTLNDINNFFEIYKNSVITDGMIELINALQKDFTVCIISGGLYESIVPFANIFSIPSNLVYAVKLQWDDIGEHCKLDISDPFSQSKTNGAKEIAKQWKKPAIIVGDGYTDYQLYAEGLADHFIAYTEHQQRQKVIDLAKHQAKNTAELKKIIYTVIHH